jgi:hypothetical protein
MSAELPAAEYPPLDLYTKQPCVTFSIPLVYPGENELRKGRKRKREEENCKAFSRAKLKSFHSLKNVNYSSRPTNLYLNKQNAQIGFLALLGFRAPCRCQHEFDTLTSRNLERQISCYFYKKI